jgi:hypothetical protein
VGWAVRWRSGVERGMSKLWKKGMSYSYGTFLASQTQGEEFVDE